MKIVKRDKSIDFLKGTAIIAIMLCHSTQIVNTINVYFQFLSSFGQLGCQVFFFISGYLMSKKHLNISVELKPIKFMFDKVGVIIPWYLAILLYQEMSIVCKYFFDDFTLLTNSNPIDIVINCLFLNGVVPRANNNVVFGGWYLGTLFIVWLLFPFLHILFIKHGEKTIIVLGVICIMSMIYLGCLFGYKTINRNTFLYFSFVNQLPCVLYGMLFSWREQIELSLFARKKHTFFFL